MLEVVPHRRDTEPPHRGQQLQPVLDVGVAPRQPIGDRQRWEVVDIEEREPVPLGLALGLGPALGPDSWFRKGGTL